MAAPTRLANVAVAILAGVFKSLPLFSNMSLLSFFLLLTVFQFSQRGFVFVPLGWVGSQLAQQPKLDPTLFL